MGVNDRIKLTVEELLVLSMTHAAVANAAHGLRSSYLTAVMDALADLERGRPERAAERILLIRKEA